MDRKTVNVPIGAQEASMYRLIFATAAFGTALSGALPVLAETRPVVVELFTSQGCSSCPPADAVLAELATRKDVLALGFHVDYWDGPGWKDPLSAPGSTARQNDYAAQFGRSEVYTPQIVVDGQRELVGSHRDAVLQAVGQPPHQAVAPVTFAADGRSVSIGEGVGEGRILVVHFIRSRSTPVQGGENAGRTARDVNGVEALKTAGEWKGQTVSLTIEPAQTGHGVAVLVQADDGRILGAASLSGADS
jgi:hypothetical protein